MTALYVVQVLQVRRDVRQGRQLQRKAELCIELPERRLQHGLDARHELPGSMQRLAQLRKGLAIGFFQPQLDAGLPERRGQIGQLGLECGHPEQGQHVTQLLLMH